MFSLFLKYFFKQKKYVLFFIVIILSGIVISSVSKIKNCENTKKQIEKYKRVIENDELTLLLDKKQLEEGDGDIPDFKRDELVKYQEIYSRIIKESENYIEKIKNSDWQYLYESELYSYNNELITSIVVDDYCVSPKTVEITFKVLTYLKENNISSAHPLKLQRTEFDNPTTSKDKKALDNYSKKCLVGTSHRLWDFMNNNLVLFYIFIIVVGPGMFFAGLEDNKNKTIRFLRTSGVSKFRIVFSGLVVGAFLTLVILALMLGVTMGIEFLINGSSSFKYPIVTYYPKESYFSMDSMGYNIVTISKILIKSIKLLSLYGIFIFLISSLVSMILKSTLKSAIVTFGIIISLQMFPKYNNPFSYWNVGRLVDGSMNILKKTITYSYDKSIIYLMISICSLIVILFMISFIENRQFFKRRIKNA